jgi:hypothetical protein
MTFPWVVRDISPKRSKNDHFFEAEKNSPKNYLGEFSLKNLYLERS